MTHRRCLLPRACKGALQANEASSSQRQTSQDPTSVKNPSVQIRHTLDPDGAGLTPRRFTALDFFDLGSTPLRAIATWAILPCFLVRVASLPFPVCSRGASGAFLGIMSIITRNFKRRKWRVSGPCQLPMLSHRRRCASPGIPSWSRMRS